MLYYFRRTAGDPDKFIERIFASVPNKTQQVLRREGLRRIDLLELPDIPMEVLLWFTHLDVVLTLPPEKTIQVPTGKRTRETRYADGFGPSDATAVSTYGGSSTNSKGGRENHKVEFTSPGSKFRSLHYDVARRPGAIFNSKLFHVSPNLARVSSHRRPH
ncbi:hypothetical protein PG997_014899 [Apiospora hydei]|uniref:Uncharacterized protein n=1 Tax=Apiospora hydei TaxID=1337664 RepID=A0ABR1UV83_9PEZI